MSSEGILKMPFNDVNIEDGVLDLSDTFDIDESGIMAYTDSDNQLLAEDNKWSVAPLASQKVVLKTEGRYLDRDIEIASMEEGEPVQYNANLTVKDATIEGALNENYHPIKLVQEAGYANQSYLEKIILPANTTFGNQDSPLHPAIQMETGSEISVNGSNRVSGGGKGTINLSQAAHLEKIKIGYNEGADQPAIVDRVLVNGTINNLYDGDSRGEVYLVGEYAGEGPDCCNEFNGTIYVGPKSSATVSTSNFVRMIYVNSTNKNPNNPNTIGALINGDTLGDGSVANARINNISNQGIISTFTNNGLVDQITNLSGAREITNITNNSSANIAEFHNYGNITSTAQNHSTGNIPYLLNQGIISTAQTNSDGTIDYLRNFGTWSTVTNTSNGNIDKMYNYGNINRLETVSSSTFGTFLVTGNNQTDFINVTGTSTVSTATFQGYSNIYRLYLTANTIISTAEMHGASTINHLICAATSVISTASLSGQSTWNYLTMGSSAIISSAQMYDSSRINDLTITATAVISTAKLYGKSHINNLFLRQNSYLNTFQTCSNAKDAETGNRVYINKKLIQSTAIYSITSTASSGNTTYLAPSCLDGTSAAFTLYGGGSQNTGVTYMYILPRNWNRTKKILRITTNNDTLYLQTTTLTSGKSLETASGWTEIATVS